MSFAAVWRSCRRCGKRLLTLPTDDDLRCQECADYEARLEQARIEAERAKHNSEESGR